MKSSSTTDIVDALVSKGVLTEEEGKLISKGHVSKTEKTPVVKEKDGAFSISSPNGKNSIQLTGRLHFDAKYNDIGKQDYLADGVSYADHDYNSGSMASHFNIRRARLGIKGRLGGIADYELVGNFGGTPGVDVAFLDINKYEPLGLVFGKFKVAPNLEIKTSSNNIDMIERSYVSQNVPEKKFGAALHGEVKGLTYFGSIFQNNDTALSQVDHNVATAGRATANFAELMNNKDMVLHVGLNGYSSNYQIQPATTTNTSDDVSAKTRATVFQFNSGGQGLAPAYRGQIGAACLANTGYGYNCANTADVKANNYGLEGIAAYNNFKLQGEWSNTDYSSQVYSTLGTGTMKASTDTWYAEALWIVTGEKYADAYKKGAFGALKPKNEFDFDSSTGWGLWELGARVDAFDVSDTSATGESRFQGAVPNATNAREFNKCANSGSVGCDGGAKSYTASVKWVMTPNMLIKANWTYTDFDNAILPIDILAAKYTAGGQAERSLANNKPIDHENLLMIRGQYMF